MPNKRNLKTAKMKPLRLRLPAKPASFSLKESEPLVRVLVKRCGYYAFQLWFKCGHVTGVLPILQTSNWRHALASVGGQLSEQDPVAAGRLAPPAPDNPFAGETLCTHSVLKPLKGELQLPSALPNFN